MKKYFLLLFLLLAQLEAAPRTQPKIEIVETSPQNWDFFGDFLIWYASEKPSSNWANHTLTTVKNLNFNDHVDVATAAFDWDYGFRAGVGYTMEHDRWDTQLYWSWFRTEAHNAIPTDNSPPNTVSNTFYLEFDGSFLNGDMFLGKGGHIDWSLLYNMADWELGRNCAISRALTMRPFIGIKGGWIHQTIEAKVDLVSFIGSEKLQNRFWGIGPSGGMNTRWEMGRFCTHSINLLGEFATGMLWGNWNVKDVYKNPTIEIPVKSDITSLGSLTLKGFLGLGWDIHTCRYGFALKLGYEMQIWFNQLRLPTLQQLPVHGDLTLQGGTFNARFDF